MEGRSEGSVPITSQTIAEWALKSREAGLTRLDPEYKLSIEISTLAERGELQLPRTHLATTSAEIEATLVEIIMPVARRLFPDRDPDLIARNLAHVMRTQVFYH